MIAVRRPRDRPFWQRVLGRQEVARLLDSCSPREQRIVATARSHSGATRAQREWRSTCASPSCWCVACCDAYAALVPVEKRWVPDQVPGFPPGAGPAAGRGTWVDVYVESRAEREAAYRSARSEAERVGSECEWIASEATASEVLETVSPGHKPRLFRGAPLREAWSRLASTGGLPPTQHQLRTVRRGRKRTLRGIVDTKDIEGSPVLVWPAPRGDSGAVRNDYLDARGNLYTPHTGRISPGGTYLIATASAGAADGATVQLVIGDDLMRTTVAWTSEILPSVYVGAVCSALRHALHGRTHQLGQPDRLEHRPPLRGA